MHTTPNTNNSSIKTKKKLNISVDIDIGMNNNNNNSNNSNSNNVELKSISNKYNNDHGWCSANASNNNASPSKRMKKNSTSFFEKYSLNGDDQIATTTKPSTTTHAMPVKNRITCRDNKNKVQMRIHRITLTFILLTCLITAFSIGYLYKNTFSTPKKHGLNPTQSNSIEYRTKHNLNLNNSEMPVPTLYPGKELPEFKYTYKHFNLNEEEGDDVVRSSHTAVIQDNKEDDGKNISTNDEEELAKKEEVDNDDDKASPSSSESIQEEEEVYEPAGQHLLLDLKNVNSQFLNSEVELSKAIVQITLESELTLLSYHCHGLYPTGVSCVGVLLESHISLHTWPEEGVILLDLFTCGSGSLLPLVDTIQSMFGVEREGCVAEECRPRMVWSHKLRGFRESPGVKSLYERDIGRLVLEPMVFDYKKEVASIPTKTGVVDIYDIINPKYNSLASYELSTSSATTYHAQNPQYYKPNRHIFLEGVLQKNLEGSTVHHESFVHPGMFTHTNPKNVWIVNDGGDGGLLHEVLKHDTVKQVLLHEEDVLKQDLFREYVPELQDCTDVGATSCYNDTRVQIIPFEAFSSYMNHTFHVKFDVVIVDLPLMLSSVTTDVRTKLQDFINFVLEDALEEDGIVILELGLMDMKRHNNNNIVVNEVFSFRLEDFQSQILGNNTSLYHSVHFYQEAHAKFAAPMMFGIICKTQNCTLEWLYTSHTQMEQRIHDRQVFSSKTSTTSLFHYFDASTFTAFSHQKL